MFKRALNIRKGALSPKHPDVASSQNGLAMSYLGQQRYDEAEAHYIKALSIWEKSLGKEHPFVALSLTGLATVYRDQGDMEKSEPYFKRSLMIRENVFGENHELTLEVRGSLDELRKSLNSK
ncbi:MAG: tetratricopeptide (TPR) repeat protein [Chlamydiales bacterium]